MVTGTDKSRLFCQADIFCFPSFFKSENQSLVLIEAMQFGLPIVATDWRSTSTMIEDGVNGFIVSVRDVISVADRLAVLMGNWRLREEMGKRARQAYLARFTDTNWYDNMGRVLKEA
ncbi:hypothetical protein ASG82_22285 [Mycobacterium sp. Soil538]|nr:hypothetical protein ASG82_22285 [Mycobacterium sp. Soil538]